MYLMTNTLFTLKDAFQMFILICSTVMYNVQHKIRISILHNKFTYHVSIYVTRYLYYIFLEYPIYVRYKWRGSECIWERENARKRKKASNISVDSINVLLGKLRM